MRKQKAQRGGAEMSVAEAIATAEAWNERAALLSTMAFELTSAFGVQYEGDEPPYLIKRIGGGATAANPALVEEVRAELFAAAGEARARARSILTSAAEPRPAARTAGLSGNDVTPSVNFASVEIPSGGDEIVANPRSSASRQKLGDGPFCSEDDEGTEERGEEVVALPPGGPPRRGRHRSAAEGEAASRAPRAKREP